MVTDAGIDKGLMKQVAGVSAPVMAPTTYTVSSSMKYKGVSCGRRTTTVDIKVLPFEDL
ncbi:hypothetical protein NW756_009710 [Fusarium oxysporum]|uniref:Uncharacterized protein n=2 Tax=Fusarium oxysporum TaxID=5507 RepID=A0A420MC01_FUSOX|nr:hypothetical protein FOTG_08795 [Fusarium oxysporum f. sp. vasinfectum 25433]KAJ4039174.1 hypothetical protein NW763_012648 [Fusarium oxysporum]KAK2676765.1 hypothetical protein RAB80_008951 [Fusarium oxysporum f. sp. vasinfectum]KAJ4045246.1 hypothetical protein NW753_009888 [Fusarium oxysporum]KAJ4083509.1 hypothetical protein NW756_009710 [Fusarium oxysporum]